MFGLLQKTTLFSRTAAARSYAAAVRAKSSHAGGMDLWRKLSLLGAVPAVSLVMLYVYLEHTAHAHDPKPEYIPYDHLRKRDKRYPWGDGTRTLFHNPHTQWHPEEQH